MGAQDQRDIEDMRMINIGHEQVRKRLERRVKYIDAFIQSCVDLITHYVIDFSPSFNKKI